METKYITLTKENIDTEHICCAFSDKKCSEGYGMKKAWLQSAIDDAKAQGKNSLVTVAGTKKFHFMSDTKWLLRQGFKTIECLPDGFSLLTLKLHENMPDPSFKECVKSGTGTNCTYPSHYIFGFL